MEPRKIKAMVKISSPSMYGVFDQNDNVVIIAEHPAAYSVQSKNGNTYTQAYFKHCLGFKSLDQIFEKI